MRSFKVSTAGNIEGEVSGITNFQIEPFQPVRPGFEIADRTDNFCNHPGGGTLHAFRCKIRVRQTRRKDGDYRWASAGFGLDQEWRQRERERWPGCFDSAKDFGRAYEINLGFRCGNRVRC